MTEREVMRLLKGVHELEMQEMEERLARERVACVPLLRARELVLDPGRWTKDEREHVTGCRRCTRLLESAERTISHPMWWTLLLWTLGKLSGEEAQAMRWHMEDGRCQRCLRLTQSGLFRALTKLVEEGQQTREQVQALEDTAVTAYDSLRLAGQTQPPFQRRVVRPDGRLTVTVRETPRHDLVAHVETPDPALAGQAVRVELLGSRDTVAENVVLEAQEANGCAGERTFGPFGKLTERLGGDFGLLAVPAEQVPGAARA